MPYAEIQEAIFSFMELVGEFFSDCLCQPKGAFVLCLWSMLSLCSNVNSVFVSGYKAAKRGHAPYPNSVDLRDGSWGRISKGED